jgi:AraC-like DNA-binding protein
MISTRDSEAAMDPTAVDEILARRFRIDRPPTLVARRLPRGQVAFSRMSSCQPMRGRSLAVPSEAAFSFHVPLGLPFFSDLRIAGRRETLPPASLGDAFLFDLNENPTVGLDTSFDSLRFYVPQAALDEMAHEAGIPGISGLRARQFGGHDPIMYAFAQALAGAMGRPGESSAMFCEQIALAFFAHIVVAYGGLPLTQSARGGLARWQLRRAYEFIDANLGGDLSISDVAEQCGLSAGHFSRAFKHESGLTPHRWLTKRRLERAKQLLEDPQVKLADIAQICGFVDQSHFARVFSKGEGCSPGRWRRLKRCRAKNTKAPDSYQIR